MSGQQNKDAEKLSQLEGFLNALPERELRKLAAAIELDRHEDKFGLPHDAMMRLMRPGLARIRAPRIYTPQRILCLPFEDMLIPRDPDPKEVGRIARASIMPMWKWLTTELMPDSWPPLAAAFIAAQKSGQDEEIRKTADAIWAASYRAMSDAFAPLLGDVGEMRKLAKHLGGTRRLEDVREMTSALGLADEVRALKEMLPQKPVLDLTGKQVAEIKRAYQDITLTKPGEELVYILLVIARLLQPFPILKVFSSMTDRMDDLISQRKELSLAGDKVFEALEEDVTSIETMARDEGVDEEKLLKRAKRFAGAFKTIVNEIGIRRDGPWGKRVYGYRSAISGAIETRVLSSANKAVLSVLAVSKDKDGKVRTARPDFSEYPSLPLFEEAERRAKAIAEANRIADQIGLSMACQNTIKSLREELDKYAARIIEMLPRTPEDQKLIATAHLNTTVRLIELVGNSEDADLLRRRGNAALNGTLVS